MLTTDADDSADLEPTGESDIPGDIFNAPLGTAIDGLVGAQTLQEADVIVGTDEIDVLNAALNGTGAGGTYAAPTIQDVEVLNLTARGGFEDFVSDVPFDGPIQLSSIPSVIQSGLDLFNSTGYEEIWNINSDFDLAVVNIREVADIGMRDVTGGTTYALEFTSSADTDVVNVIAEAVGTSESTGQAYMVVDASNGIGTLNLDVSDTVRLDLKGDAADMSVFNMEGSGVTELTGEEQFENLVTLNAAGYTGDLTLDVSGSSDLESVVTGEGNDLITVLDDAVDGDLSVDMDGGFDILQIVTNPTFDTEEINALDFTGGIGGVENLAFGNEVVLDSIGDVDDTVLDLGGFDGSLETVWFFGGFDGYENWSSGDQTSFTLANAPDVLTINAFSPLEDPAVDQKFWAANLGTGDITDLTINAPDAVDIYGVDAPNLESLTINQTGVEGGQNYASFWVLSSDSSDSLGDDTSSLQNVSVTGDWSQIIMDVSGDENDADALETISLSAADTGNDSGGNNANLKLTGAESEIPAAEQAVVAAESGLDTAEADRDAALIAESNAQDDVDAAQAVVDAAQTDVNAAQADVDAAQTDVNAAQTALSDAQNALSDAEDSAADAEAAVQTFDPPFDGLGFFTGSAERDSNEADLKNFINSSPAVSAGLAAALIANLDDVSIQPVSGSSATTGFTESNINDWLTNEVPGIVDNFFNIPTLTADEAAAQSDLNDAQNDLTAAQNVLNVAEDDLDTAQDDLADAQSDLAAAQTAFSDAEDDLAAAQQNLADAQAALADAEGGTGFDVLETVTVDAETNATVNLENVYGAFDLEVTAGEDAFVTLTDTNVQNMSIAVGDTVEYELDSDDDIIGFDEIDTAAVTLAESNFGNPNLEALDVSGAQANVSLSGDLFDLDTVDLTDVTEQFMVDATGADFGNDLGDPGFVIYQIGGTSSEWDAGFSTIDSSTGDRETFKFNEDEFGTIVIDGFNTGSGGDRIDLSEFGFTNEGQLVTEQGNFDETDGSFTIAAGGDDVRILDDAGGPEFEGTIILENSNEGDLVTDNYTFA